MHTRITDLPPRMKLGGPRIGLKFGKSLLWPRLVFYRVSKQFALEQPRSLSKNCRRNRLKSARLD